MKTILVPSDFSKAAESAAFYAAGIAKPAKAKIILFHVYHVPVSSSDIPIMIPDFNQLEKEGKAELKKLANKLQEKNGHKLQIECICKCGFAVDEINIYTFGHKTDLIVMGTHGAGYLAEKLIGSVTYSMIKKSNCPVLAINKDAKFSTIKKIALACDYENPENKKTFGLLKELVHLFGAHVHVVNVVGELEPVTPAAQNVSDFMKLEHSMTGISHSFSFVSNNNVVNGINEFVKKEKIDMVAMVPHKHSFLNALVHEPNTKKMAFHGSVPLLALH